MVRAQPRKEMALATAGATRAERSDVVDLLDAVIFSPLGPDQAV